MRARVPYLVGGRRVVDDGRACFAAAPRRVLRYRAMLFDCSSGTRFLVGIARGDVEAIELSDANGHGEPSTAKLVGDSRLSRSRQVFVAPVGDHHEVRALGSAGVLTATIFSSPFPSCPAPEGFGGLL